MPFSKMPALRRTLEPWRNRAHWAWGCAAGFIAAAMGDAPARRRPATERWVGGWRNWLWGMLSDAPRPGPSFAERGPVISLQQQLLGRSRKEVVVLLGPPAATSVQPLPATKLGFWKAEIWYYPLDLARRHAVAITFVDDRADAVERIAGPA